MSPTNQTDDVVAFPSQLEREARRGETPCPPQLPFFRSGYCMTPLLALEVQWNSPRTTPHQTGPKPYEPRR
jgi:hypothetical protein